MKNNSNKKLRIGAMLSVVLALAACGGGGGGSTDSGSGGGGNSGGGSGSGGGSPSIPEVVPPAGNIKTSIAAPTYTTGSLEADGFATLNQLRAAGGFGQVNQLASLDTAAARHVLYLVSNPAVGRTRDEQLTNANYFAPTPGDRQVHAGYPSAFAAEAIGDTGSSLKGGDCVRNMLDTVYNGSMLLSAGMSTGLAFATTSAGAPLCVVEQGVLYSEAYPQVVASGKIATYPYPGQTNVPSTYALDTDVPRLPKDAFPNATAGRPIFVNIANADYVNLKAAVSLTLSVTKFELKDSAGNLVPASIRCAGFGTATSVKMTPDGLIGDGLLVLVPTAPLARNATYTVNFGVTIGTSAPISTSWNFQTGS